MHSPQIHIRVNGEQRLARRGLTLFELIAELGLDPQRIAVELNRAILRRPQWQERILADGDSLEIVEFVGGGCIGNRPTMA